MTWREDFEGIRKRKLASPLFGEEGLRDFEDIKALRLFAEALADYMMSYFDVVNMFTLPPTGAADSADRRARLLVSFDRLWSEAKKKAGGR